MRPALLHVFGKQMPSARNLFWRANLPYVHNIKMLRRLRSRFVHFLGTCETRTAAQCAIPIFYTLSRSLSLTHRSTSCHRRECVLSYTHPHTHTHTRTHSHTLSFSLSQHSLALSLSHAQKHVMSHMGMRSVVNTPTHTYTYTHQFTHSLARSRSHTREHHVTDGNVFCRTHTHTHIHIHIHTLFRSLSITRDTSYGVASASRIDKIIGLFCKRALQKRQYSATETYNFIDPTDRSHPISLIWICSVAHRPASLHLQV